MGLPFDGLTLEEAVTEAERVMSRAEPRFWATANLDFATQAAINPALKRALLAADRVLADGQPLVWMSRLLGTPLPERVAGSDLTPRLLASCARRGHAVYLFGSDEVTLKKLQTTLPRRYPGLKIAGAESPPMGGVDTWDNTSYVARMQQSEARLLLVALGCPKQELWIKQFHQQAGIPLAIGIGASLDFLVGKQVRAPRWMRPIGLEWAWRLCSDPRRLTQRYARDFAFLARRGIQEFLLHRRRRAGGEVTVIEGFAGSQILRIKGNLDTALAQIERRIHQPNLLLDCRKVSHLGTDGWGMLLQLARFCKQRDGQCLLVRPSAPLRQSLSLAGNEDIFTILPSFNDANKMLRARGQPTTSASPASTTLLHLGEPLTTEGLDKLESQVAELRPKKIGGTRFLLNVSSLATVSREAVRRILLLRETLLSQGLELRLEGSSPTLTDMLELLGVAQYLLAPTADTSIAPKASALSHQLAS